MIKISMEHHKIICDSLFFSLTLSTPVTMMIINKYKKNINNNNSYHRYLYSIIVTM